MTEEWKQKHVEQAKKREAELEKTAESYQTHPYAEESDIIQEKEYDGLNVESGKNVPPAAEEPAEQSAANAASQIMKGIQPPEQEKSVPTADPAQGTQDDLL